MRLFAGGRHPYLEDLEFNRAGVLANRTWESGGLIRRTRYIYDAAGREIESREVGPGGGIARRREYDARGRLLAVRADDPSGPRLIAAREYRADGSCTEHIPAPVSGPPRGVLKALPGSPRLYRMPGLAAVRTEFSPAGLPHWSAFESPGRGYAVFRRHGESGLLAQEFSTPPGVIEIPGPEANFRWPGESQLARLAAAADERTFYERDSAGRITREVREKAGIRQEIRKEWDIVGNLSVERTRRPDGSAVAVSYDYEYDAEGNWTRRRSSGPGGPQMVTEDRRTITYY